MALPTTMESLAADEVALFTSERAGCAQTPTVADRTSAKVDAGSAKPMSFAVALRRDPASGKSIGDSKWSGDLRCVIGGAAFGKPGYLPTSEREARGLRAGSAALKKSMALPSRPPPKIKSSALLVCESAPLVRPASIHPARMRGAVA